MGDLVQRERKTRRMTTGRACALVGLAAILAASARPAVAIDRTRWRRSACAPKRTAS